MDLHGLVSKVKELAAENKKTPTKDELMAAGISDYSIRMAGGFNKVIAAAGFEPYAGRSREKESYTPKILVLDIETVVFFSIGYVYTKLNQKTPLF